MMTGRPLMLPCFPQPNSKEGHDEYTWVGHLSEWLYQIGINLTHEELENPESPRVPNARNVVYKVGDKVAIWHPQRAGVSKKLYRQFSAGGIIMKVIGNGCYQVEDEQKRKYTRNTKYLRKLPNISDGL